MRVIRALLVAMGLITLLIIFALAIACILFSLTPSMKSAMRPVAKNADAAQSLDKKIQAFEADIKSAISAKEKKILVMTLTEEEINSKLIELIAEDKLPMKEILVNLDDGHLTIYAVWKTPGIAAKTGAKIQLKVTDNDIKFIVQDFQAGKLPLPQSVDKAVSNTLNVLTKMQTTTTTLLSKITKLDIIKGQLKVEGTS